MARLDRADGLGLGQSRANETNEVELGDSRARVVHWCEWAMLDTEGGRIGRKRRVPIGARGIEPVDLLSDRQLPNYKRQPYGNRKPKRKKPATFCVASFPYLVW